MKLNSVVFALLLNALSIMFTYEINVSNDSSTNTASKLTLDRGAQTLHAAAISISSQGQSSRSSVIDR